MVELYSKYRKDLISLANMSKITQDELADALKNPYNTIFIPKKHNKKEKRPVDIPHDYIKPQTTILNKLFRQIPCPVYNYAGYEGRNAYQNAKAHIGNFAYVTMDIKSYYPNTKAKYVYQL